MARLGSFWPIMAAVTIVTAVVVATVVEASVVRAVVVAACWAMSTRILIEVHLGFLDVGVLVGGCDRLADPRGWLTVELRAKLAVMTSASVMFGIEFLISEKHRM